MRYRVRKQVREAVLEVFLMLEISWLPFIAASVFVILVPGQDLTLVISRALSWGTGAGVETAAGVSTGLLVHTIVVTLGVGALLQTSTTLLLVLKTGGALYLAYLGVMLLRTSAELDVSQDGHPRISAWRTFMQGAVSNMSNPKIVLFYLAFLPQFVPAKMAHPTLALFLLGTTFAVLTFLIKAPIAVFAGQLSASVRRNPRILVRVHKGSGLVLLLLGALLVFEH